MHHHRQALFALFTVALASISAQENKGEKPILEMVAADRDFSKLSEALKVADLVDTLAGAGPFTVFAPTDEAFETLGASTLQKLLEDQKRLTPNIKRLVHDEGHLNAILKYHVIKGRLTAKEVIALAKDGKALETANGAKLKLKLDGDKLKVNDAVVVKSDVLAGNGIIHVIDRVLLPPAPRLDGKYKRVPACPPVDESFVWQRALSPAAPQEDKDFLVELWKRAGNQSPPAGKAEDWKKTIEEIVGAAELYAGEKDRRKAGDLAAALERKVNCIQCHATHRKSPFANFP